MSDYSTSSLSIECFFFHKFYIHLYIYENRLYCGSSIKKKKVRWRSILCTDIVIKLSCLSEVDADWGSGISMPHTQSYDQCLNPCENHSGF